MKQALSFPLELLELPPSEEIPLVSALVANQNYAQYVGACSARLTDASKS
jgi:hypothetical protein